MLKKDYYGQETYIFSNNHLHVPLLLKVWTLSIARIYKNKSESSNFITCLKHLYFFCKRVETLHNNGPQSSY
jgi:hypothetical protein